MASPAPDPDLLTALHAATARLVGTAHRLGVAELGAASLLPGWTRGHVLAHLALNAEALAGVLAGAGTGRPVPMYASQESRDADIEALAATPGEVTGRLERGCAAFADAVATMAEDDWARTFERVPGGPVWPTAGTVVMRHSEVEIHHADLGAGYAAADWPEPFAVALVDQVVGDQAGPFLAVATDVDREWTAGSGGPDAPVVRGPVRDLGWWLVGRGEGRLTCSTGPLPPLGPWGTGARR